MKKLELIKIEHNVKIGQPCQAFEPNITEDCIFTENGQPVGFFIREIEGKLKQYVEIANKEFNSKNVPKSKMNRGTKKQAEARGQKWVSQYSTIIGSVPPKAHMRRPYPSRSSVHAVKSAETFVKAMLLACKESEKVIKEILPEQYEFQKKCIEENVPKEWRFGELFTSSISNYNIPAPFHRDTANLKGCVNVIITKRNFSKGGNLHIPDYNATMDSCNNSLLVYPAWKNVHGVTPIETFNEKGYRNSLVFYPLASFRKFMSNE